MALSTTVQANISVGLDDQFTDLSKQAFEEFQQTAERSFNAISKSGLNVFKKLKEAQTGLKLKENSNDLRDLLSSISIALGAYGALGTSVELVLENSKKLIEKFRIFKGASFKLITGALKELGVRLFLFPISILTAIATGVRALSKGIGFVLSRVVALGPALVALGPAFATAAAAIGTFALAWEAGKLLGEFKVGDKTINQYVFDAFEFWLSGDLLAKLENSFDGLILFMSNSASNLANTFINGINNLPEMVEGLGQAMLNAGSELVDSFGSAVLGKLKEVKNSVLSLFAEIKATLSKIPSISDVTSGVGNIIDGIGDLIGGGDSTGSSDSGGNAGFSLPKFDTGIDRVPRDMLAIIHKDEAVLNSVEAQKFRSGNQGGAVIQNLNINIPQGIGLKREQFRQLAMGLRDEIHRLDRRMSR
ncbi:MAG: hypothetical protein HOK41_05070 [Nitrospina sp.]|jgi:hypothetical protein|nr:hypothetical protein [Nitrospina sp.]